MVKRYTRSSPQQARMAFGFFRSSGRFRMSAYREAEKPETFRLAEAGTCVSLEPLKTLTVRVYRLGILVAASFAFAIPFRGGLSPG